MTFYGVKCRAESENLDNSNFLYKKSKITLFWANPNKKGRRMCLDIEVSMDSKSISNKEIKLGVYLAKISVLTHVYLFFFMVFYCAGRGRSMLGPQGSYHCHRSRATGSCRHTGKPTPGQWTHPRSSPFQKQTLHHRPRRTLCVSWRHLNMHVEAVSCHQYHTIHNARSQDTKFP